MQVFIIATFLFFALSSATVAPHVPNPPESFRAEGQIFIKFNHTHHASGPGHWMVDQPKGRAEEKFELDSFHIWALERFDLGWVYEIDSRRRTCNRKQVPKGSFKPVWGWLKHAHYAGKVTKNGFDVEWFEAKIGDTEVGLGVDINRPDHVRILYSKNSFAERVTVFHQFQARHSWSPEEFKVPRECEN